MTWERAIILDREEGGKFFVCQGPLKSTKILYQASILFLFIAYKYEQVLKTENKYSLEKL